MSRLLGGRYRLGESLGGGGTALVHRATPVGGGPDVAVKVLRPQFAADASLRRRFLREAELARRLDHPSIVRVLDVGADMDSGGPFLVLELVPAETLRQLLDRVGTLPPLAARAIFAALARALDHAHARGVLHRDLKPQNVFVADDGTVKLGDFGNARVVSLASVTGASLTWGTPEYVAPEVFGRGRADPRSDLYALGALYHEMLTGRLPWTRAEALTRLAAPAGTRPTFAPTGAGEAVDRVLADLLAPAAADRPASGAEALSRLDAPDTTALSRKPSCTACGAPRPDDVPRCLACGREILRLRHDPRGRWRLILDALEDDATATEKLLRVLDPLVTPPGFALTFLTGNGALHSQAEQKRGIHLPAVLMARLDEATARALAARCQEAGLAVRALEGTLEALAPPKFPTGFMRQIVPFGVMSVGVVTMAAGNVLPGLAAGAAIVALFYYTSTIRPRTRGLRRARGLLELRAGIDASPAAEALLTGAADAAARVRAPEVRALFADVSVELYRLTRRAEELRRHATAASSEVALLERTIAAAPALTARLGQMAAHLDALDDALATGSEGELMQTLGRLERADAAPDADRGALAAVRRDVEAALERRAAAEQERARLSAALCQLLGGLRQVYARARALETFDETTARALEAASAELEAALAA